MTHYCVIHESETCVDRPVPSCAFVEKVGSGMDYITSGDLKNDIEHLVNSAVFEELKLLGSLVSEVVRKDMEELGTTTGVGTVERILQLLVDEIEKAHERTGLKPDG